MKEEKKQQIFQPCFPVPDSPGSVVLVLETFMREDLKFPLRTAEFLRVGWMVFASLFRKENLTCISLQTVPLSVAKQWGMETRKVSCLISQPKQNT